MTYKNDPNINRPRTPIREERSYTGWIVAAVAALAVVVGVYAMSSGTNIPNTADTTPPVTTGSAIPSNSTPAAPTTTPAPAPQTSPTPAR
jgi:hypothetical protein